MFMRKYSLVIITLLLAPLFLSACSGFTHLTPEQAVIRELTHPQAPFPAILWTIRFPQKVEFENQIYIMATFQSFINDEEKICTSITEADRKTEGWMAVHQTLSCLRAIEIPDKGFSREGSAGQGAEKAVSYLYGNIYSPDIVKVQVTWPDDEIQQVEVVNRSYIILREGFFPDYVKMEGLDTQGEVIYTFDPNLP
jgi:hypothetical protein